MERIGIVGAGLMGRGIAKNLMRAGYDVLVHKRRIEDSDPNVTYLRAHGIEMTTKMEEVFTRSEVLFTCLPDSPTVEHVLIGPGGLTSCEKRAVRAVLDFTTALPESTRKIARILEPMCIDFIDTPMTGGPKHADEGKIKLVVGGRKDVVERYRGLLEKVSERIVHVGESGSGNAVKLANNFLSILNRASGAAVAILLSKMDIPLESVHEFISVSGGNSNGFQSVMRNILQDDFSVNFALELAYKDLRYGKTLFEQVGGFPLMDAVLDLYKQADDTGYGKQDVGAIYLSLSERMIPR